MIKFTCPKCSEPLEAPESLTGQPLQCPQCRRISYVPEKSSNRKKQTVIFLSKIWNNSPPAFRTGFLTTMGVIAAIMISLFAYNRLIMDSPSPQAVSNVSLPQTKSTEPKGLLPPLDDVESFLFQ